MLYQLSNARQSWMYRNLLTTPWFASPNLLLGREVYPEFCFHGAGPEEEVCTALERCYKDSEARSAVRDELEQAAQRLGPPGAAERAARQALGLLTASPPAS